MNDQRGWPAWTAQVDDLVGGWIVTTYPYPASEHDHTLDGDPLKCGYIIAQCMTAEDAVAIAHQLNHIKYAPANLADPERWRWVKAGFLEGTLRG